MNVAARPIAGLAVCAGVGAIELGLQLALGRDRYRTVGYIERDAYAAACLVARMADEALDQAPVWDDVATFDGGQWRGRVDLVSAGFPCQPFSQAGTRRGVEDERWLWPDVARVVREVGPGFVFLENVRGFLAEHGGLGAVLGDLARLGFDAQWTVLSAAAVGATHRRERFWLLAYRHGGRLPELRWGPRYRRHPQRDADRPSGTDVADAGGSGRPEVARGAHGQQGADGRRSPQSADLSDGRREAVADTDSSGRGPAHGPGALGRSGPAGDHAEQRTEPDATGGDVADTAGTRPQGGLPGASTRRSGPAERGFELPLWPPAPDDWRAWERVIAAGGPQPSVRRVAAGPAARLERLHALGNSVVPIVAAHAFLGLARRAGLLEVTP